MKTCDVCGVSSDKKRVSTFSKYKMTLCPKHYGQMVRYNKIIDTSQETIRDRNRIIIENEYAKILVNNNYFNRQEYVLIDKEDVEKIKDIKWMLNVQPSRYFYTAVVGTVNGRILKMSRFLMDYNGTNVVDHINGNTLDNRKQNLRIITATENKQNVKAEGISKTKNNRWQAHFQRNKKIYTVGMFDTKEEAQQARKIAVELYNKNPNEYSNDLARALVSAKRYKEA